MKFEYYYGNQADQFTFIRIPKMILTHEAFAGLSIQAKVLYGVLLDRMGLSMKNGWLDENRRVYIIYQIQEIQEDLGFSRKKSMDYLTELERIGLVEKKRRGLGLPSILYVKSFLSGTSRSVDLGTSEEKEETKDYSDKSGASVETTSQTMEIDSQKASCLENRTGFRVQSMVKEGGRSKKRSRSVDLGTSRSVDSGTSRGAEIALQEVPDRAPLNNNTNINNTYESNIQSNHILSAKAKDEIGCDSKSTSSCRTQICENIEYNSLLQQYPYEQELLDGIVDIMLEVMANQNKSMLIASATYPTDLVKSRFQKLNSGHIQYVIDCFSANTTKIGNIKKYLMTALFNAPSTISGYYTAAVHHDMPYLAIRSPSS